MKRCTINGVRFTETEVPKGFVSYVGRSMPIAFAPEEPDGIFRIRVGDIPCFPGDDENPAWEVEYIDRVDCVAVITTDSVAAGVEQNAGILRKLAES